MVRPSGENTTCPGISPLRRATFARMFRERPVVLFCAEVKEVIVISMFPFYTI